MLEQLDQFGWQRVDLGGVVQKFGDISRTVDGLRDDKKQREFGVPALARALFAVVADKIGEARSLLSDANAQAASVIDGIDLSVVEQLANGLRGQLQERKQLLNVG